jgi:hypothetical protein
MLALRPLFDAHVELADWQIVRADGAADLDARYTLETDGGALIQVKSQGLRHGPPEVLELNAFELL